MVNDYEFTTIGYYKQDEINNAPKDLSDIPKEELMQNIISLHNTIRNMQCEYKNTKDNLEEFVLKQCLKYNKDIFPLSPSSTNPPWTDDVDDAYREGYKAGIMDILENICDDFDLYSLIVNYYGYDNEYAYKDILLLDEIVD